MEARSVLQFNSFPQVEVKKRNKKSKGKNNPFFFFMMEKKEEWKAQGRSYTMKELAEECQPHWDLLQTNPKMVEPYKRKVEEYKKQRDDSDGKLDCLGRPLKALQLETEKREKQWANLEAEVQQAVQEASPEQLVMKEFFVAHFNYLCEARGGFPPCEIGIVQFSLEKGVTGCWQEFVSPLDSLPVGYKFKVIQFARGTHCLTADFPHLKKNMKEVLGQMFTFLEVKEGGEVPILFVEKKNLEAAQFITNFMLEKAGSSANLRVFPINKLVQELILRQDTVVADSLMEQDPYSHHPGLGCGLHEALDRSPYCSLSISKRLVFTLLQVSAKCHNFQLRDGQHFPSKNPDVKKYVVDIIEMRLAYDERINRMIPAPAGVARPEPAEEQENQAPDPVLENLLVFSAEDQDSKKEGATTRFPSTDIREKFKMVVVKPQLMKK